MKIKQGLFWAVFFALMALTKIATAQPEHPSSQGFYPLWENTAELVEPQSVYMGTNGMEYGISRSFSVGVDPVPFVYRAPNAHLKFSWYTRPRFQVATRYSINSLMPGAGQAFLSPMYGSRLNNRDFSVYFLNSNQTATWAATPWMNLHATLGFVTVLPSGPIRMSATPGLSLVGEMITSRRHSFFMHVGDAGLWNPELTYYGFSYRFVSGMFEGRLGYFYRHNRDGLESAPLASVGVYL